MADVPHERSLVQRLEGKPFVILGINSDKDRATVQKVAARESITWRSWFDGGSTEGPIAAGWNVHGWPTLYLIDGRGVIRYKGHHLRGITVRADKDGTLRQVRLLDEAVDALMKEAEGEK